jgi:hypothetical protein
MSRNIISNGETTHQQNSDLTCEVIIPRQRSVTLKLIMAIKAQLRSRAGERCARCSIAAKTELGGHDVAVETYTEGCEEDGKVIADAVDVLLGVY